MSLVEYGGVEIDRCLYCRGLWFDYGERESLRRLEGSESIDIGSPDIGAEYDEVREIRCPRCRLKMISRTLVGLHLIRFEACNDCGGLFLDAGEFTDEKQASLVQKLRTVIGLSNETADEDDDDSSGPPLRPA